MRSQTGTSGGRHRSKRTCINQGNTFSLSLSLSLYRIRNIYLLWDPIFYCLVFLFLDYTLCTSSEPMCIMMEIHACCCFTMIIMSVHVGRSYVEMEKRKEGEKNNTACFLPNTCHSIWIIRYVRLLNLCAL